MNPLAALAATQVLGTLALVAISVAVPLVLFGLVAKYHLGRRKARIGFARDTSGDISVAPIVGLVVTIVMAIVAVILIATLAPTYIDSTADLVTSFNDPNQSTNDTRADKILPIYGLLLAVVLPLALLSLAIGAIAMKYG